jgi:FkbM family methyltransferase
MNPKTYPEVPKPLIDLTQKSAERFWADAGTNMLVKNRNLNSESNVIDIGGYLGDWTAAICCEYDPYVFVFEPVPEFYNSIVSRFWNNPKVLVFNFGLDDRNYEEYIALMKESSTVYMPVDVYPGCPEPNIKIRNISEVLKVPSVDMMTINCEGGEYGILKSLISSDLIYRCKTIQVQFHNFYPDAERERNQIREQLRKTHKEVFNYDFVWEEWERC